MITINFLVAIVLSFSTVQFHVHGEKLTITNRIIGGEKTTNGQFPYQVYLDIYISRNGLHGFCGGSLISSNFILTAAHCVIRPSIMGRSNYLVHEVFALLGTNERRPRGYFQKVHISQNDIIVHSYYDRRSFQNDIALLHLTKPAELNQYVKPIRLPPSHIGDLVNQRVTVSGWGQITSWFPINSDILKYTETRIISNNECRYHFRNIITERILCAKTDDGSGVCFGDSGGPLAYKSPSGVEYLVGIVSFGRFFLSTRSPSGYTRVSSHVDWIRKTMRYFNS